MHDISPSPIRTGVEIGDLVPYTQYCVGVAAATGAGLGPFSEDMSVRTQGDGESCVPGIGMDVLVVVVCVCVCVW